MTALNLGCFEQLFAPPWVNTDRLDLSAEAAKKGAKFRPLDVRQFPWEWPDDHFEMVYHSHLLEHLPWKHLTPFLQECRRVLKPGGVMRVAVPDLDVFLEAYAYHNLGALGSSSEVGLIAVPPPKLEEFAASQPDFFKEVESDALRLSLLLFGNVQYDQEDYRGHTNMFNFPSLCEVLRMAGWSNPIVRREFNKSSRPDLFDGTRAWDVHPDHSLYVEVTK